MDRKCWKDSTGVYIHIYHMCNWNSWRRGENEAKAMFVVIIAENFAKYAKELKPQIEETLRILGRINIQTY